MGLKSFLQPVCSHLESPTDWHRPRLDTSPLNRKVERDIKFKVVMNQERSDQGLDIHGVCCICGATATFFARESEWGHVRESMECGSCGSSSRKRHVVKAILDLFAPDFKTLAEAKSPLSALSIYSTVSGEYFHQYLGENNSNFVCSEYFPDVKQGESKDGVICQNLECLTFRDEQFDLVITEDVFEHVRKPERAFAEVNRVLKPGGHHIFTIPFFFDRKTTSRVDTTTDNDIFVLPPDYHLDSLRDKVLVYTDFGYDLFETLDSLGFETSISFSLHRDAIRLGIADSFVFISRKFRQLTMSEH